MNTGLYVTVLSTDGRHVRASAALTLGQDAAMFGTDPHAKSLDDPAPVDLPPAQKSGASVVSLTNPYMRDVGFLPDELKAASRTGSEKAKQAGGRKVSKSTPLPGLRESFSMDVEGLDMSVPGTAKSSEPAVVQATHC